MKAAREKPMLKPKEQWAVVRIHYDGTEQIDEDGDWLCVWDDPTPAHNCIEQKREDMRESRKIAKRKGGESGFEGIRGYRIAKLMQIEVGRVSRRPTVRKRKKRK
jgi:hypothetical protein